MPDFPGRNQAGKVGYRDQLGGQVFTVVKLCSVGTLAVLNQHREARIALDRRIREDLPDNFQVLSYVARLFPKFPGARLGWGKVLGIDYPTWDFQFYGVRSVAILLDHDEFLGGGDRDNIHPIRTVDDVKIMGLACSR